MIRFIGFLSALLFLTTLAPPVAAQPTAQDRLWDAAIEGDTTAVALALNDGADINALDTRNNRNGRRALNWAAWHNHVHVIDQLLSHGADLEGMNRTGFTALHHAAESGSIEALQTLVAAGADPNAANLADRLPIDTARRRGHTDVVELLEALADDGN